MSCRAPNICVNNVPLYWISLGVWNRYPLFPLTGLLHLEFGPGPIVEPDRFAQIIHPLQSVKG